MKERYLLFKNFRISRELRIDLNRIVWGACAGFIFFMTLFGAPFSGFVRSLGVGDFLYGVIMALPVMGGLFQVFAAYIVEKSGNRKKWFFIGGILQRFVIIPMVILPLIIPAEMKGIMIVLIMLFLMTSAIGGAFNHVTFFSWMAVITPQKYRGRFFSIRQMVYTSVGLVIGLLISFILDKFDGYIGFAIVFIMVTIFGLIEIACFIKIGDQPMDKPETEISLSKMWKEVLGHTNYRKYLLFWAVWTFGMSLSTPFFAAYMLEYLDMNYVEITLYTQTIFSIFTIIFVRVWGNMIDRFGNKPVLKICGLGISLIPILWCMTTPSNYLMVPFLHILAGQFMCGIEITSNNLMMGLSPDKNRSFYIANFSMVTALVGSIMAYFTGGLLMELTRGTIVRLNIMFMGYPLNNYHLLFIISAIIRFSAIIVFLPFVTEDNSHGVISLIKYYRSLIGVGFRSSKDKFI